MLLSCELKGGGERGFQPPRRRHPDSRNPVRGFVAYKAFCGYMVRTTTKVSLRVQHVTAMSVAGGQNYASATVKNTGTTHVENVTVTIINSDGNDVTLEIGTFGPGETGSDKASHNLAAGVTCPVQVPASLPGNSPEKQQVFLTLEVRVS